MTNKDISNQHQHQRSRTARIGGGSFSTARTDKVSDASSLSTSSASVRAQQWANSEAYFFNEGAKLSTMCVYVCLNIIMVVWGVWEFNPKRFDPTKDDNPTNDILAYTLPIARGSGRVVTFNCALILLTASKHLWTIIRRRTFIPLGFPVDNIMPHYHRVIALTIIVNGCILHTIPQIINYVTGALPIIDGLRIWTFGDGTLSTKQLLYTGILLVVTFAGFFVTTLKAVRKTAVGFRLFWTFHVILIVSVYPLLIIHGTIRGNPILLYFTAAPLGIYIGDVIFRRIFDATSQAQIVEWNTFEDTDGSGERVTKLVIYAPGFHYTPGQYAELKLPSISKYEWHPFTIASAPNNKTKIHGSGHVEFYIKAAGRWTNKLYDMVNEHHHHAGNDQSTSLSVPISIRGPHGAPASNYLMYEHIVLIGSGIGVTPLLSIWKYLVGAGSQHQLVCEEVSDERTAQEQQRLKKERALIETDDEIIGRVVGDTVNSVDVVTLARTAMKSTKIKCAYGASVLETMTVNVCLLCLSFLAETTVFSLWLFKVNAEAALLQMAISTLAILIYGSKVLLSIVAYGCGRYCSSFIFGLEMCIIVLDGMALITSVGTYVTPNKKESIAYFCFFALFLLFHTGRIFYIFYATARPPAKTQIQAGGRTENDYRKQQQQQQRQQQHVKKLRSIKGIWVSKYHSSMSFAAMDLVNTLDGLSKVFSLEFYGTREKKTIEHDMERGGDNGNQHAMRTGRPDWESILRDALDKAYASCLDRNGTSSSKNDNDVGDDADDYVPSTTVGVFFCGSPAIARELQRTAQKVTAQHQLAVQIMGGTSRCRILVHKENF